MQDPKEQFFTNITNAAGRLTPSENTIAEHLMRTWPGCMLKTASELSGEVSVNVSTVTRFFQKIGYRSIKSAQAEFREEMERQVNMGLAQSEQVQQEDKLNSELWAAAINDIANIEATVKSLKSDSVDIFLGQLSSRSNRVFVSGGRNESFALAWAAFCRLREMRPGVTLLEPVADNLAAQLALLAEGDVLLLFSFRQGSAQDAALAKLFQKHGGRVILFTDSPLSPLVAQASQVFEIQTVGTADHDTHVAGLSLLNLLLGMLARNWQEYRRRRQTLAEELVSSASSVHKVK